MATDCQAGFFILLKQELFLGFLFRRQFRCFLSDLNDFLGHHFNFLETVSVGISSSLDFFSGSAAAADAEGTASPSR